MQNDIELFLYYLSAHLAASISVIDVMKYEFNSPKRQEFLDWFEPQYSHLEGNGFDELNRLRIAVVHLAGNLAKNVKKRTGETVSMVSGNVSFATTNTSDIIEMPLFDKVDARLVWRFKGNTQPVIATCQYFIDLLEKLVADCEAKFLFSHAK